MIYTNFSYLRKALALSEAQVASKASVSRLTVRQLQSEDANPTLKTMSQLAQSLHKEVFLFLAPEGEEVLSRSSTVAVSLFVSQDEESWPLHYMELVDTFRRSNDFRLFLLPPVRELSPRMTALLASVVCALSAEVDLPPPEWAKRSYFLPKPWFPSEMESLKALALRDSPIHFRKNNIFVQDNFLKRV